MERKIFSFIGAPASGKGTRIDECVKKGYTSISTGLILRKRGYDLSTGFLMDDKVVIEVIREEIARTYGSIILDGFPRTMQQAKFIVTKELKVDKIFYLHAPIEVICQRASKRLTCLNCQASFTKDDFRRPRIENICDHCGGQLIVRPDDSEELLKRRIQIFQEQTEPIIDMLKKYFPIVDIDTTLPPEKILEYI